MKNLSDNQSYCIRAGQTVLIVHVLSPHCTIMCLPYEFLLPTDWLLDACASATLHPSFQVQRIYHHRILRSGVRISHFVVPLSL